MIGYTEKEIVVIIEQIFLEEFKNKDNLTKNDISDFKDKLYSTLSIIVNTTIREIRNFIEIDVVRNEELKIYKIIYRRKT